MPIPLRRSKARVEVDPSSSPCPSESPYWATTDGQTVRLYLGHVVDVLRQLPERSVQCVVTSPPYWGLRDYSACSCRVTVQSGHGGSIPGNSGGIHVRDTAGPNCRLCNGTGKAAGMEGQLGSEPSPDCGTQGKAQCGRCFVCAMVGVFREVKRVLRDDGTLWLNLGDSYNGGPPGGKSAKQESNAGSFGARRQTITLAPGNLVGVPWRVALALQADGWVLRQDIIWAKPSPMPECLDPETRVFVRINGWVSRTTLARVYTMKVKPEVLGPNGWVKIINIWKTVKPAMMLEAGKAERVICSPDHKFPVSHDNGNLSVEDKPAADIRATGYRDYLLYHPIGKHLTPILTEWEGVGLTGHLGYVLGLYAAEGSHDGGHRMKWTIHAKEDYIKNKFNKSLHSMGLKGQALPDPNSNAQNLVTTSEWLQRTIQTFVFGKDARTKRLNIELLLNSPAEFRRRLLEGYIDGDGSDRGDGWGASSASRDLRDDLSTLASSLGIITSKGYNKSYLPGRDKEYHSHSLWTPYFNRSTKKGAEGTYQILPRGRKNLDGEREMIDMEVEGNLFLIGDGLVTHNSVRNRCTKAHEYVFLLTKRAGYFYDAEAIKEKSLQPAGEPKQTGNQKYLKLGHAGGTLGTNQGVNSRNKRSVWTISSQGYPGAHFATYPPNLIRPMILAGTSEYGACVECGAPWRRVTEKKALKRDRPNDYVKRTGEKGTGNSCPNSVAGVEVVTRGWEKTCKCATEEVRPCVVLDPFIGSGTTAEVCLGLGRACIGVDLSEVYLKNNAIPRVGGALLNLRLTHLSSKAGNRVELRGKSVARPTS